MKINEIKNKIAIVSGASSGIGEATARLLTRQGARVVLVARSQDKILKLASELPGSLALVADMSKAAAVKDLIKKVKDNFGQIDILINNAGQGYFSAVADIDLDKYRYLWELNVVGPLVAMQAVIPIMKEQGGGLIINISSGTTFMYIPNLGAYSSTKRALNGLTLTARAELAKDNIRVSLIHPYITATNFYKNTLRNEGGESERAGISGGRPAADSAESVAEKILATVQSEEAEVFTNDSIKRNI